MNKSTAWMVFACLMIGCGADEEPTPTPMRDGGTTTVMDANMTPPPPKPARCTGVATSCILLAGSACSAAKGCTVSDRCTGSSTSCSLIFSCTLQDGCYRNSSGQCTGFARSCSSYFSDISCGYQDGCRWTSECSGSATQCDLLSASECSSQPGCRLEM